MDILVQIFPKVCSLRDFLEPLSNCPPLTDAKDRAGYKAFLHTTVLGIPASHLGYRGPVDYKQYSEQMEVVNRVLYRLYHQGKYGKNVLLYGFSSKWGSTGDFHGLPTGMSLPNNNSTQVRTPHWWKLLSRIGDELMMHILENLCVFVAAPPSCYIQLTGVPISTLMADATQPPKTIRTEAEVKVRKVTSKHINKKTCQTETHVIQTSHMSTTNQSHADRLDNLNERKLDDSRHLKRKRENQSEDHLTKKRKAAGDADRVLGEDQDLQEEMESSKWDQNQADKSRDTANVSDGYCSHKAEEAPKKKSCSKRQRRRRREQNSSTPSVIDQVKGMDRTFYVIRACYSRTAGKIWPKAKLLLDLPGSNAGAHTLTKHIFNSSTESEVISMTRNVPKQCGQNPVPVNADVVNGQATDTACKNGSKCKKKKKPNRTPRRLIKVQALLKEMLIQHKKVSIGALLNHHCPVKVPKENHPGISKTDASKQPSKINDQTFIAAPRDLENSSQDSSWSESVMQDVKCLTELQEESRKTGFRPHVFYRRRPMIKADDHSKGDLEKDRTDPNKRLVHVVYSQSHGNDNWPKLPHLPEDAIINQGEHDEPHQDDGFLGEDHPLVHCQDTKSDKVGLSPDCDLEECQGLSAKDIQTGRTGVLKGSTIQGSHSQMLLNQLHDTSKKCGKAQELTSPSGVDDIQADASTWFNQTPSSDQEEPMLISSSDSCQRSPSCKDMMPQSTSPESDLGNCHQQQSPVGKCQAGGDRHTKLQEGYDKSGDTSTSTSKPRRLHSDETDGQISSESVEFVSRESDQGTQDCLESLLQEFSCGDTPSEVLTNEQTQSQTNSDFESKTGCIDLRMREGQSLISRTMTSQKFTHHEQSTLHGYEDLPKSGKDGQNPDTSCSVRQPNGVKNRDHCSNKKGRSQTKQSKKVSERCPSRNKRAKHPNPSQMNMTAQRGKLTGTPASKDDQSKKETDTTTQPQKSFSMLPNDAATLITLTTKPWQAYLFIRHVLLAVVPKKLWGSVHNRNTFLKGVKEFVQLGRFERLSLKRIMKDMKIEDCDWCLMDSLKGQRPSFTSLVKQHQMVADFFAWLMAEYVIPLIKMSFYITETATSRNQLVYYRKPVWFKLEKIGIQDYVKNGTLKPVKQVDANKLARAGQTLGFSRLRFVPKTKSLRPITKMGLSTLPDKKGLSIRLLLQDLFDVLTYHKTSQPSLLGASLLGTDAIYTRLVDFIQERKAHDDSRPLYFVKVDIEKCYDSIKHSKLYQIISLLLQGQDKPDEYQVHRYITVTTGTASKLHKLSHRHVTTGVSASGSFHRQLIKLAHQNDIKNAVIINLVSAANLTVANLLQKLRQHVMSDILKIGRRYFQRHQGISQGSILSSLFCSFFYAHLERCYLSDIDKDGLLMRLIDDFLLITPHLDKAQRFLQVLLTGVTQYGCTANPAKTLANFNFEINGKEVPTIGGDGLFPWCGLIFNTRTFEVSNDYSKYDNVSIRYTLTMHVDGDSPLNTMRAKLVQSLRAKSVSIFLDPQINSFKTIIVNTYHLLLLLAYRFHSYYHSLPPDLRENTHPSRIFSVVIICLRSFHALAEAKLPQEENGVESTFPLTTNTVKWLGLKAFHSKLKCHQAIYKPLLKLIRKHKRKAALKVGQAMLDVLEETTSPAIPPEFTKMHR